MAKAPEEEEITVSKIQSSTCIKLTPAQLLVGLGVAPLTFSLVNEQTAGAPEVDGVVDPEALHVLTHLPPLWEFRVNVFEVNLSTIRGNTLKKLSKSRF